MIRGLAFRNIAYRPWRSLLLFFGYGIGVAVMIVLLSIGEAMLSQARNEKLVGGGSITVLPEGLDVEVMKTGGIGGLFFSIDHAAFLYRQLLASPRFAGDISAVAPQIEGRLLYIRAEDGSEYAVHATGEIPSATRAVGAAAEIVDGKWEDDEGDRRWIAPTAAELRHEIDHFHLPSDTVTNKDTWAEWHYFNVLLPGGPGGGRRARVSPRAERWAFISFIIGGDVTGTKWGGSLGITLREQGGRTRRFVTTVDRSRVRFSTSDAHLIFGDSRVTVLTNGDYEVRASAREERGGGGSEGNAGGEGGEGNADSAGSTGRGDGGKIDIALTIRPAPYAYFPGVSMGSGGFVSGYTVPALRASASGSFCVDGECERLTDAQAYHDHNWGVWRGVTWEWGAARAGGYTFLYGRVYPPDTVASVPPVLVYLIDSLGFRAVFRPKLISYEDGRTLRAGGSALQVPSRAILYDARGEDTLRIELSIEDAIATDTRPRRRAVLGQNQAIEDRGDRLGNEKSPYFIQMKGTARISGRLDGERLQGVGTGFFETFR